MQSDDTQFDVVTLIDTLGLPTQGRDDAVFIFTNEPGRLVRSSPFNSAVRYWSERFRMGVQAESRTLAAGHVILAEFTDPDLRALVDEVPIPVTVQCVHADGTRHPVTLRIDHAKLYDDALWLVDVMRSAEAMKSIREGHSFYEQAADGTIRCPGIEAWAAARGFRYRIVTEADIPVIRVANWLVLGDASRGPQPAQADLDALVERVAIEPRISYAELVREGFDARTLKWAIAHEAPASDLDRHLLTSPEHFPLYSSREVCEMLDPGTPASWAIGAPRPAVLELGPGVRVKWGEIEGEVVAATGREVLLEIAGTTRRFDRHHLVDLWRSQALEVLGDARPLQKAADDTALTRYRAGGREGVVTGLKRAEIIRRYDAALEDPDTVWATSPKSGRRTFDGYDVETIREWIRDRKRVKAATGDNFAGLVPKKKAGNRTSRQDPRVDRIFLAVVRDLWTTPDRKKVKAVAVEVRRQCEAAGLKPLHPRTVRKRLDALPRYPTALERLGSAGAYKYKPHDTFDPDSADPNGVYPNHTCHIDHTVVDVQTAADGSPIDPFSPEAIGRLKLTRAVDGCSRREIAHRFTFDAISGTTVLQVLIAYAEATGRLPEVLVLDNDPGHRSIELLAFCEAYGITIVWRGTRQSRDSWVVERGFKSANDDLFHNMQANTQMMRNVREVTDEIDPRHRAVHRLVELDGFYTRWVVEYNAKFHPVLGSSRDTAWANGLAMHGVGREVVVDERMRFLAMPFADGTTRVIQGADGVKVNYLRYEHAAFTSDGPLDGATAEVRVDPEDVSRVFVIYEKVAYEAICPSIARLRVITRTELALLSELIRKDLRDGQRLEVEFERRLAVLLADVRAWETNVVHMRAEAVRQAKASKAAKAAGAHDPQQGVQGLPSHEVAADVAPPSGFDHLWTDDLPKAG